MKRVKIINDTALNIDLPKNFVQCVVTSPPYFGLRDYGVSGQLGIEKSPEEYIENLVLVFRKIWDILKDDGTVWLNIGDTYATKSRRFPGIQPKNLIGIPWEVAFALRNDGWYLRQDIIWHKPNAMPESVKDRFVNSHEYIFLLSKNERYYFDYNAILEPANYDNRTKTYRSESIKYKNFSQANSLHLTGSERWPNKINGFPARVMRDVWSINTKPFNGNHFAVFPDNLAKICILAGSRVGDTVFDPFLGSGTTLLVAAQNDREAIGYEINKEYCFLAKNRLLSAGFDVDVI
jgi:DNA modification methylase